MTDLNPNTIATHYREAKEVIKEWGKDGELWRIGNRDFIHWYINLNNGRARPYQLSRDYTYVKDCRTIYGTTSLYYPNGLKIGEYEWDEENKERIWKDEKPLPDYHEIGAINLYADVDLVKEVKKEVKEKGRSPELKELMEKIIEHVINKFVELTGEKRVVKVLDSGGGFYVLIDHVAIKVILKEMNLSEPQDQGKIVNEFVKRFNRWLESEVKHTMTDEMRDTVDVDLLNKKNTLMKVPLSIHKSLPWYVHPIDIDNPDYEPETPPVSEEIKEKTMEWVQSIDEETALTVADNLVTTLFSDMSRDTDEEEESPLSLWKHYLWRWLAKKKVEEQEEEERQKRVKEHRKKLRESSPEETDDKEVVYAAIQEINLLELVEPYKSSERSEGEIHFDPSFYRPSKSKDSAVADEDGFYDIEQDCRGDAAKFVALEEDIISSPCDELKGDDWRDAVEILRQRGYKIPELKKPSKKAEKESKPVTIEFEELKFKASAFVRGNKIFAKFFVDEEDPSDEVSLGSVNGDYPQGTTTKVMGALSSINVNVKRDDLPKIIMRVRKEFKQNTDFTPPEEGDDEGEESPADKLVKLVVEKTELFSDQHEEGFAAFKIEEGCGVMPVRSRVFKRWISFEFYNLEGKAPANESINSAINTIEGKALFEGDKYHLANRVGGDCYTFYYDLGDREWNIVKITADGWSIVPHDKPLFRRFQNIREQVQPAATEPDSFKKLVKHLNIKESDHVLVLAAVASYIVPDIPHPIIHPYGEHGMAKTTACKMIKEVVDPGTPNVLSLPGDSRELVQQFYHHYLVFFDNISELREWQSDELCKAITGGGNSKRALYTDEDDVIFTFKRCILLNGINIVTNKPDLFDRSILFETGRIENWMTEEEVWAKFYKDLPYIVGGLFSTVSEAMKKIPDIKKEIRSKKRMADFTVWGEAIARVLEYEPYEFYNAYEEKIKSYDEEIAQSNVVGELLIQFVGQYPQWEGSPSDLLKELKEFAKENEIDIQNKEFPRVANMLTRKLNTVKPNLRRMGIIVENNKNRDRGRVLKITTPPGDKSEGQPSSQPSRSSQSKTKNGASSQGKSQSSPKVDDGGDDAKLPDYNQNDEGNKMEEPQSSHKEKKAGDDRKLSGDDAKDSDSKCDDADDCDDTHSTPKGDPYCKVMVSKLPSHDAKDNGFVIGGSDGHTYTLTRENQVLTIPEDTAKPLLDRGYLTKISDEGGDH